MYFFKSRVVQRDMLPQDAVYIFGDNHNVSLFNGMKLSSLPGQIFKIPAIN